MSFVLIGTLFHFSNLHFLHKCVLMYFACPFFSGATDGTNSDPPGKDFLFGG